MASVRINVFENMSNHHAIAPVGRAWDSLGVQGIVMPGSLSFNTIGVVCSAGAAATITISFGLYSLNGSTLSLANSASQTYGANGISWVTMVTSATQDITPGNWWLGIIASTGASVSMLCGNRALGVDDGVYNGILVRGLYSVSSGGLAASAATSDFTILEGSSANAAIWPYIVISA